MDRTNILPFLISLCFGMTCFGQSLSNWSKADSIQIERDVERKVQELIESLENRDELMDSLLLEFAADTLRVEERKRFKQNLDNTTNGIVTSIYDATEEYDVLLNNYYQHLMSSLNDDDKEILRKSQKHWIEFRDSELELNRRLMDVDYTGGGTIHKMIAASRVEELTKHRVIELYRYLRRQK